MGAMQDHGPQELRRGAADHEAVLDERSGDVAWPEQRERPRVALDPALEAEEAVRKDVGAAARRVVHDDRCPRDAARLGDHPVPGTHVGQQAEADHDIEGTRRVREVGEVAHRVPAAPGLAVPGDALSRVRRAPEDDDVVARL